MSFVLNGVISKEEIRNLFIPSVTKSLVSSNFVTSETVLDAASVKIPGIVDFNVSDYTGTVSITDATDTSVLLTLDQAKYFAKQIDKVDNAQSAVKVIGKILDRGAYATAAAIDTYVFDILGSATNTVTATTVDETDVIEWVLAMGTKLSTLGAPLNGRKLAISPEVKAKLAQANIVLNTTSAEEASREGYVGRFGGFDIYESLNLKAGATTGKFAVATVEDAAVLGIGYQQYDVSEPDHLFKYLAKGLANYGAKIVQPAYVVACDVIA